jgi:hypothetical protein
MWLSADEITDVLGRYIPHVTAEKLDLDKPSKPHILCSETAESE